jgi:hypothetical protein
VKLSLARCLLLGVFLVGGCTESPPSVPDISKSKSIDGSDAMLQHLAVFRKAVMTDEGAIEAEAENHGSAREVFTRLGRLREAHNVGGRIPAAPEADVLVEQVKAHCLKVGVKCTGIRAVAREVAPRSVPKELVGAGRVDYTEEMLRGVVDLSFVVEPIAIEKMKTWMNTLGKSISRMVQVVKVRAVDRKLQVQAEGYWFLEPAFPVHRPKVNSEAEYFSRLAIPTTPQELRTRFPAQYGEIEKRMERIRGLQDASQKTLTLYAEAHYLDAQWRFFEGLAERLDRLTLMEVFE